MSPQARRSLVSRQENLLGSGFAFPISHYFIVNSADYGLVFLIYNSNCKVNVL